MEAWEAAGVDCVQLGMQTEVVADPRPAMRAADIVVAKARAALEAMSCGRAVYLYDQFGGDGWITPDNYPSFEADHFAGQGTTGPRSRADLAADLGLYNPDMGIANSELIHLTMALGTTRSRWRLCCAASTGSIPTAPTPWRAREACSCESASGVSSVHLRPARRVSRGRGGGVAGPRGGGGAPAEDARFLLGTRRVRAGFSPWDGPQTDCARAREYALSRV